MARTKASRGAPPFELRSGNNLNTGTPYPFLGKIAKALTGGLGGVIGKLAGKNKATEAAATAMGEVGGSVSGSDKKLAEIAKIALSDEGELGTGAGEGTHLTKKKNNYKPY